MIAALARSIGPYILIFGFPAAVLAGTDQAPPVGQANAPTKSAAIPQASGLYTRINDVQTDLDALLLEMGRNAPIELGLTIHSADLREVYYASLSMFHKANRLSFELRRRQAKEPKRTAGSIRFQDIEHVIISSQNLIARTLSGYKVKQEKVLRRPVNSAVSYSEILSEIITTNRKINALLERPFSPSDVFQEITLGVGYAANLLTAIPNERRIPATPPFEKSKHPGDVYIKLYGVLQSIIRIASQNHLSMLDLDIRQLRIENVLPGDVYDLAKLVVAQLAYLNDYHQIERPTPRAFYPGLKLPSHVYQRVALLERQVKRIEILFSTRKSAPHNSRSLKP